MKRMIRVGLVLVAILCTFALAVNAQQGDAQNQDSTGLNIEISPAKLLLEGKPGKSIDASIKIRNRNAGVENLKLEIFKVTILNDKVELLAPEEDDEFVGWVKFGKDIPFKAPHDQFIDMPVIINLPATAAFAYNYAILISKAETPKVQPGETQAIEGKVAQFILLDVFAPGALRAAQILDLKTSKGIYSFLPVNLTTTIKNTGNLHVTPVGNIFIKNMSGKQIATLDLNRERGTIIPPSTRQYENLWSDGFPRYEDTGSGNKLVWNWQEVNKFRFGKYRAEAVVVYNDGTRDVPLTADVTFWVLPWALLLLLLVVVIILFFGIYQLLRSVWRAFKKPKNKSKRR